MCLREAQTILLYISGLMVINTFTAIAKIQKSLVANDLGV